MTISKSFLKVVFLLALIVSGVFIQWQNPASAASLGGLVPCGTSYSSDKVCTLCHLVLGVQGLVQWGLKVMTYIALAVITAMGILYIMSGVDTDLAKTAKGGIKASLTGFVLMLGGWVIINFIITSLAPSIGAEKGGNWYTFVCSTKSSTGAGNYTSTTSGGTAVPGGGSLSCGQGACAQRPEIANAVKNNSSGVEPNIIMAMIQAGEGCNKKKSPAGACGYGQTMHASGAMIRPWCGIPGTPEQTCASVQNDLQLDINCAAKLIGKDGSMQKCLKEGGVKLLAACYNRGRGNALKGQCGEGSPPYCQRVESYYNSCKK